MDSIFSIGIQSLWDELSHMPVGGVWWINTDRNEDAISLVNQTIAAQDKDSRVAVISMGEEPKKIITLESDDGPQTVRLFSMSAEVDSLYFLSRDVQCSIDPDHYLVILKCANNVLKNCCRGWKKSINGQNFKIARYWSSIPAVIMTSCFHF